MKEKVLEIVNLIRDSKGLSSLELLKETDTLREDLGFTSFDLAELTVRIEDLFNIDIFENGLISTIGDIYQKLDKDQE